MTLQDIGLTPGLSRPGKCEWSFGGLCRICMNPVYMYVADRWLGDGWSRYLRHNAVRSAADSHVVCGPGGQHGLTTAHRRQPGHETFPAQLSHHGTSAVWPRGGKLSSFDIFHCRKPVVTRSLTAVLLPLSPLQGGCFSLCLFAFLLPGLCKNWRDTFHKIWWKGGAWAEEENIRFRWKSRSLYVRVCRV